MTILLVGTGCGGHLNAVPGPSAGGTSAFRHTWSNDIGPRFQWNHNYGYCGEVSFVSAGLYYGQYLSQYDARAAASNAPQNRYRSQLLLGVNDLHAAKMMHLTAVEWERRSERSTDEFLVWVKQNVVLGRPVTIGIFMNQFRFYHNRNPNAGSPQYDHIVPVIGVAGDQITFSDNGEWGSGPRHAQYFFSYRFRAFQKTRRAANAPKGSIYSIANDGNNFGVAITGVVDENHETRPVQVATNINYERPQIAEGSSKRPAPEPLVLTITVSGLKPGKSYNLYRYNRLDSIPDRRFNANAARAYEKWVIVAPSNGKFVLRERISSDEVAAYRAVPAGAP